jgi:hypothetical protein
MPKMAISQLYGESETFREHAVRELQGASSRSSERAGEIRVERTVTRVRVRNFMLRGGRGGEGRVIRWKNAPKIKKIR